ncbi:MAG: hypothetical protein NTZ74_08910 [Chloroflexi bacterium]|nr:hypothetical protein [Chloroflexota bacterium]
MEGFGYILICIGPIIIGVIVFIIANNNRKNVVESNTTKNENEFDKIGFITSNKISLNTYILVNNAKEVRVDINNKNIALVNNLIPELKIISFGEILSCETVQDNSTISSGGVGRAIVGGVLAGGVGALIGASTGNSKNVVSELKIKITTRNLNAPLITMNLITSQISRDDDEYKKCIEFADMVQATMNSIISQKQEE